MGVLRNPPHRVLVRTRKEVQGAYGPEYVYGETHVVDGTLQPMSTSEESALNVSTHTTYRFICKSVWPGGPYSEVTVLNGPEGTVGVRFDQHGDARGYSTGSRRTHRQDVVLARLASEVS